MDLKKTGTHDDERINVDRDHEVRYWAEKFGVSGEQLRQAVQAAGPIAKGRSAASHGAVLAQDLLRHFGANSRCRGSSDTESRQVWRHSATRLRLCKPFLFSKSPSDPCRHQARAVHQCARYQND
ncbi:MAG TPA: DUF3606 domain-containing protein [Burkholderiales bacterium]|nr:DUF3606 domain-containing protein [Burkholderiales bacterium]